MRSGRLANVAAAMVLAGAGLVACVGEPAIARAASNSLRLVDCAEGCPELAIVPAGTFTMGTPGGEEGRPEGPVHEVTIARPFALATLEVSNADYAGFLAATGREVGKGCWQFSFAAKQFQFSEQADYTAPGDGAGDGAPQMPAVCVSWTEAQAYVGWLAEMTGKPYRLPTEAEWEYAAKAGSTAAFPWGEDINEGCTQANIYDAEGAPIGFSGFVPGGGDALSALANASCNDGHLGAAPVGSYPANAFGLHDMVGNVWEWTQDCYAAPYPEDISTDGSAYQPGGACERRSVRGGSWITSPFRIRPAWRGRDPEDQHSWIFGFRVARDLSDNELESAGLIASAQ